MEHVKSHQSFGDSCRVGEVNLGIEKGAGRAVGVP